MSEEQPCFRVGWPAFYKEWRWCEWKTYLVSMIWFNLGFLFSHYWPSLNWWISSLHKKSPSNFDQLGWFFILNGSTHLGRLFLYLSKIITRSLHLVNTYLHNTRFKRSYVFHNFMKKMTLGPEQTWEGSLIGRFIYNAFHSLCQYIINNSILQKKLITWLASLM